MNTYENIDSKDYVPKESINTVDIERGFYPDRDEMSDIDDDLKSKQKDEIMDIMYSVCMKYSENLMMN